MMMNMVGWGGVRLWRVTVRPNDHIKNISNRWHFLVFYPQQIVDCTDLISDHCYCYCYCLSQWSHQEYLKWKTDSIHLSSVLISDYCAGMNITFTYWSDFFAHYRKQRLNCPNVWAHHQSPSMSNNPTGRGLLLDFALYRFSVPCVQGAVGLCMTLPPNL